MTELATFGICVAIVLCFLIGVSLFFGSTLLLLILIFPVLLSEAITGEGGTFSPNGSGKKSPLFKVLATIFLIVQVLLVAGVLYGIYRLIFGWSPVDTAAGTEVESSRTILTPLAIDQLQMVNGVLWLLSVSFVLLLLDNILKYWDKIKLMTRTTAFVGYVLPIMMYPFAFLFLTNSRNYLTHYPDGDLYLGSFSSVAGILYGIFLLATLIWSVHTYLNVLLRNHAQLGLRYWIGFAMSLLYKILYFYFLIRIFNSF